MPEDQVEVVREVIVASAPMRRDRSNLYTPIAIVLAGLLIAIGLFAGLSDHSGSSTTATTNGTQVAPAVNIDNVKTQGEPYIGSANAPVVMAFWSDYQCPFCKAFEVGGVPQITTPAAFPSIVTQYVNTGKVKVVFKDFQFLGQDSIQDGEWARAIWNLYPQEWYAWRTTMYTQQPEENSLTTAQNLTHLEQVAGSIKGISVAAVEANVAKNQSTYNSEMSADEQEGEADGISGTPGFIIGTQLISGDQPLATFTAALNAQLK